MNTNRTWTRLDDLCNCRLSGIPKEFTIIMEKGSVPIIETKDINDPMVPEHVNVPIGDAGDMPTHDLLSNIIDDWQNRERKEYNTMYKSEKERNPYPKCTGIIQRGRATIVNWNDGTKTTIVAEEGKEVLDMFHAFCIAFTKKMLGSTTNILKTIEANDMDAQKKAEDEMIKKHKEERRNFMKEMENAAFEKAVQEKMYDQRVHEEAVRRIIERKRREQEA